MSAEAIKFLIEIDYLKSKIDKEPENREYRNSFLGLLERLSYDSELSDSLDKVLEREIILRNVKEFLESYHYEGSENNFFTFNYNKSSVREMINTMEGWRD